jgi:hypothetical protein
MLACWELLTVLAKEIQKSINLLMFLCNKLLMREAGEEQVGEVLCCIE